MQRPCLLCSWRTFLARPLRSNVIPDGRLLRDNGSRHGARASAVTAIAPLMRRHASTDAHAAQETGLPFKSSSFLPTYGFSRESILPTIKETDAFLMAEYRKRLADKPAPFSRNETKGTAKREEPKKMIVRLKTEMLRAIWKTVQELHQQIPTDPLYGRLGLNPDDLAEHLNAFEKHVSLKAADLVNDSLPTQSNLNEFNDSFFLRRIREAALGTRSRLSVEIKYAFYAYAHRRETPRDVLLSQRRLTNLRHPPDWYPDARRFKRTIHLHVGPTNSGKTYNALKRLEQAESGVYAGPLRLLAYEVWSRLNAKGKICNLITGDDRRIQENAAYMASCTVEMVPLGIPMDVAVIDEIQMIADDQRGWAWTQALLGLQAKEIHLCGEARVVPLIQDIAKVMGDDVQVHNYERLNGLKVEARALGANFNRLRKGDCIVSFNIRMIHALRRSIERMTKKKCAVIYGSLPPETRAQQAKLFNDPDNDYDFLVASNAIGMGLNLSIRRVIFQSSIRFNGLFMEPITAAETKQIGGRAGRFRTAELTSPSPGSTAGGPVPEAQVPEKPQPGLVTTLEAEDLPNVTRMMQEELPPLKTAGLFPASTVVERFSKYFPPDTPFSYIMLRFYELGHITLHRYHLCRLLEQLEIFEKILDVREMSVADRLTFMAAPFRLGLPRLGQLAVELAQSVASGQEIDVLGLQSTNLGLLDDEYNVSRQYLTELEELHQQMMSFIWLAYRYPNLLVNIHLGVHVKELVEARIEKVLSELSFNYERIQRLRRRRGAAAKALNGLEMPLDEHADGSDDSVATWFNEPDRESEGRRTFDVGAPESEGVVPPAP